MILRVAFVHINAQEHVRSWLNIPVSTECGSVRKPNAHSALIWMNHAEYHTGGMPHVHFTGFAYALPIGVNLKVVQQDGRIPP